MCLLEHVSEVEAIILDKPCSEVEACSIGEEDEGHGEGEGDAKHVGFLHAVSANTTVAWLLILDILHGTMCNPGLGHHMKNACAHDVIRTLP